VSEIAQLNKIVHIYETDSHSGQSPRMPFETFKHLMLCHAIAQDDRPVDHDLATYQEYTLYTSTKDGDSETLQPVQVVAEAI